MMGHKRHIRARMTYSVPAGAGCRTVLTEATRIGMTWSYVCSVCVRTVVDAPLVLLSPTLAVSHNTHTLTDRWRTAQLPGLRWPLAEQERAPAPRTAHRAFHTRAAELCRPQGYTRMRDPHHAITYTRHRDHII